jgi:hypothetical protein
MLKFFLTTAILAGSLASPAQQEPRRPPVAPDTQLFEQRTAMRRLDFMLGTWTGSGWMMLGPGQRAEFNQTEVVQRKLDGTLLTIDGDGRDKNNSDRIVHNAFAVFTYNPETKQFRFQPFLAGQQLDLSPTVSAHGWAWGFDAPYGKTRFTLDFADGNWHEIGEFSRDGGQTWMKNFEMTLTKAK